jgi:hypothetical protein
MRKRVVCIVKEEEEIQSRNIYEIATQAGRTMDNRRK